MKLDFYKPRGSDSEPQKLIASALDEVLKVSLKDLDARLLKELKRLDDGFNGLEVPIFEDERFRLKRGFKVDIYHPQRKIAIEIEKTEVKNIWKTLIKFSIGNKKQLIEHAILICPKEYRGKGRKVYTKPYSRAIEIYEFMKNLYFGRLLIIGY